MPSFSERRQALKSAYASTRAEVDVLKIACLAVGADYRTVSVPPADASPSAAMDKDTVRRWPKEAYAGRRYQLRCEGGPGERLRCGRGALEAA
jgi:hypothetical protein